jgi:nicotinate phosphoribosyltransferase
MDFATRQYNHNFRMDPIVRSRLDTDTYKFLMGQVIDQRHPMTQVRFSLTNRTSDVRLADIIDERELREQLDHARTLRYTKSELIWLRGQTFFGEEGIFKPGFIASLARSHLPEYELSVDHDTGQYVFETEGRWLEASDWEVHALSIFNELRDRALLRTMSRSTLDIVYARAKVKLYAKLERLRQVDGLTVSDFGTRRRHSHLWQEHCVTTAAQVLGDKFVGTSNTFFAMKHDLEAKGTNAHELPMVYAALAPGDDDTALRNSQYAVLHDWQASYGDNLRVFLPDTFGTTQFLADAPEWVAWWKGARPDSKEPVEAGEELIRFWQHHGADPGKKLIVFSDGMDVRIDGHAPNGADIPDVHEYFRGRTNPTFGWGTMLTNDFIDCVPGDLLRLKPISLVCKVLSANGRPAVKLSDNLKKATGQSAVELDRYRRVFGSAGMAKVPVIV